jgi:hypothetical protein
MHQISPLVVPTIRVQMINNIFQRLHQIIADYENEHQTKRL